MTVVYKGDGVYTGLSSDTKPSAAFTGNTFEETDTRDVLVFDGTYWWIKTLGPFSIRKIGYFSSGSNISAGVGLFSNPQGATGAGTQVQAIDSTNGRYQQMATGATIGNKGGYRINAVFLFQRSWNPRMRFRFRLESVSNVRYYFGFFGGAGLTELSGDSPLDNRDGFTFGIIPSTSTANYSIASNNAAATTTVTDTGIANDTTSLHTIALVADNTNSRFSYSYDGGAYTHVTTNIPAATTQLSWAFSAETSDAVGKVFRLYNGFMQSDK